LITTPWAAVKRAFLFLGSRPKSGLQVHEKLLVQAFIGFTVGMWVYQKVGWSDVWIPGISQFSSLASFIDMIPGITVNIAKSSIDVGWLMVPFVMLTIMTVTNAVNFSDGMDGLSGGLMLMAFLAYAVISFNLSQIPGSEGYRYIAYLCSTVAGALLAYLYFNVKPARVQMGDVGTLGLGALLSVIAIMTHREFTLLFTAGVFLSNGVFARVIQAVWRRVFGRRLFKIIPLHYHFERLGWPEEKVVMRFWIVGAIMTAIGVWIAGF
jgi:phospho-N-acetylmuramoyl-pentapeptide-transferase